MHSSVFKRTVLALSGLSASGLALADDWRERSQYNMREGVTEISQEVYGLHMDILLICTIIGLVVFALMFYSMFAHRKSKGHKAATFHESVKLELAWTIVPFIIVIWMSWMATGTLVKMFDSSESVLTVKVTGSQWKWHYEYLNYEGQPVVKKDGSKVGFFSVLTTPREQYDEREKIYGRHRNENYLIEVDNILVIPKDQKVRFLIASDDVIHAWWIPDFAIKKDAIPGFINELWTVVPETGIYRGQCTELCGKDHGYMPIVVEVKEQADFVAWLDAKKNEEGPDLSAFASMDEAVELGSSTYAGRCAACHGASGEGGIGAKITEGPVSTGPVAEHIKFVVHGSPTNPMMAAYGNQLSAKELAAIITFQRNGLGNSTGDLVQPADVEAAK